MEKPRERRAFAWALVLAASLAAGAIAPLARADVDGDGVPDDTDLCPALADDQSDADGDGIGDACTCGDASADGVLNSIDARLIQRCAVGLFACPELCDVTGEGVCNSIDARLVQRAAVGLVAPAGFACAQRPAGPLIAPIADADALSGPTLHVALDGYARDGEAITWTISADRPEAAGRIVDEGPWIDVRVRDHGTMRFQLFGDRAPRAVDHIMALVRSDFYDGVVFHRVIDDFVIQGGDPTGTGAGGSSLGDFDDQFHPELQHTGTGLLSMAKTTDDTNDSQFFITEYKVLQAEPLKTSLRHLDFNHTIFGALAEGEAVRDAVSGVSTNTNGVPDVPVVMDQVREVADTQNDVAVLGAEQDFAGTSVFTVRATDASGRSSERSFSVSWTPDPINDNPWLDEIPDLRTTPGGQVTHQLGGFDVDGPSGVPGPYFLDEEQMVLNGITPPVFAPAGLDYALNFTGGLLTVTADASLATGRYEIAVALGHYSDALDFQVVTVHVDP